MPGMRDSLMEQAFPEIKKQFEKAAKQQPPWRALFEALGTRPVTDTTRRVRIVNVRTNSVSVPGLEPGTVVTETTGTILPHVRVRTVETLHEYELAALTSSDATADRNVADWAERALKVGNSALFSNLQKLLDPKAQVSCTLNDLPSKINEARRILKGGHAMTLLVSAARHGELTDKDDVPKEEIAQALQGGALAPVAELPDSSAYVLRHGAGDVVVEIVHELQPHWDIGNAGSVELIALQEFVVVAEKVPVLKLTFTADRRPSNRLWYWLGAWALWRYCCRRGRRSR
jgi:hypothetical protein